MKKILITRPIDVCCDFAEKIKHQGFDAVLAPMLHTHPQENVVYLERQAEEAYVFTSPRAVKYFADIGARINKKLPVFCAGPKTEEAARNAGFTDIYTGAGGSFELAETITDAFPEGAVLLHPCGEHIEDDFHETLKERGFTVARLTVYTMEPVEKFPDDAVCEIRTDDVLAVVFFSKRTAENFNALVVKQDLKDHLKTMTAVCISKQVAGALHTDDWADIITSDRMTEDGVLQALSDLNI